MHVCISFLHFKFALADFQAQTLIVFIILAFHFCFLFILLIGIASSKCRDIAEFSRQKSFHAQVSFNKIASFVGLNGFNLQVFRVEACV